MGQNIGSQTTRREISTLQPTVIGLLWSGFTSSLQDAPTILATATECGGTFRSGRKLINPEPNRLGDNIIKATGCLNVWQDSGITKRLPDRRAVGIQPFNKAGSEVYDGEDICTLRSHFRDQF
jgi:hypothetical protein